MTDVPEDPQTGSEPDSEPVRDPSTVTGSDTARAMETMFATVVRRLIFLNVAIAVVAVPVGFLTAGSRGLYAALIGVGLAAVWTVSTAVVMKATAAKSLQVVAAAFLGSWLAKTLLTLGLVLVLRSMDFYHAGVLFLTLAAAIVGSLAIEAMVVMRTNIPSVDMSSSSDEKHS